MVFLLSKWDFFPFLFLFLPMYCGIFFPLNSCLLFLPALSKRLDASGDLRHFMFNLRPKVNWYLYSYKKLLNAFSLVSFPIYVHLPNFHFAAFKILQMGHYQKILSFSRGLLPAV